MLQDVVRASRSVVNTRLTLAGFLSCLIVVNQCTVKAWKFLTPVQNAARKKGILSISSPPPALCYRKVKDAAAPSAQSV